MKILTGNATVYVSDLERAIDFYTGTLGLELRMRAGDHWAEVGTEGLVIGLHPTDGHIDAPGPWAIRIGLHVDGGLDAAVAELTSRGVDFDGPVMDGDPVRLAYFNDPDGNPLYVWEFSQEPVGAGAE